MSASKSQYIIDLKTIKTESQSFEYDLDNDFWASIEDGLISQGNVHAKAVIEQKSHFYTLNIQIDGIVQVPCDRCLDNLDVEVKKEENFVVKVGDEIDYSDEIIYVDADEQLDLAVLFYETTALSLPIVCVHEEGKCNAEMIEILKQHEPHTED